MYSLYGLAGIWGRVCGRSVSFLGAAEIFVEFSPKVVAYSGKVC